MFAAIVIPNFSLQAVLRREPALFGARVGLVEGDVTKGALVQVTDAARAAGVAEGMTAAQALARCGDLIFKPRSAEAEHAATAILLQAAYAFSPHIENTAPGICIIDMKGLGFAWDASAGEEEDAISPAAAQASFGFLEEVPKRETPESAAASADPRTQWARNVLATLEAVHLHAQIGISATPSLALLAARAATPIAVVDKPREFVASLPVTALDPAPEMLDLLHRWGIRRVGEFLALGKDQVAERLGTEALELFERAAIDTVRPLEIAVPADTFEEQMDFEAHIETLEPLLFVLRRFVEQLATRIGFTYRVVSELSLTLSLETGSPYQRTFKVPAPTSDVETLFRMLHTHLESLRTESAITALRLGASPCRPEKQQFGLFETALRDPNQFHETLARLTALLGSERVGTPVIEDTYRPDAFRLQRPDFSGATAERADQEDGSPRRRVALGPTLRRFRPAIHAEVELEQGKPVFISSLSISSPVQHARGPWIGSGDWWDQRRWSRNEWDVELRDGGIYRLYSAANDWFLEGVYD